MKYTSRLYRRRSTNPRRERRSVILKSADRARGESDTAAERMERTETVGGSVLFLPSFVNGRRLAYVAHPGEDVDVMQWSAEIQHNAPSYLAPVNWLPQAILFYSVRRWWC
jgi:hypothetical protein